MNSYFFPYNPYFTYVKTLDHAEKKKKDNLVSY